MWAHARHGTWRRRLGIACPVSVGPCCWGRPGRTAPALSERPAGERLCSTEEASAGSGTYARHGSIFASLAGCLQKCAEGGGVSVERESGGAGRA